MVTLRRRGSRLDPDRPGKQTALVASAARVTRGDFTKSRKKAARLPWQDEAWRQYDICGELAYGTAWVANSLSRVKLFVAKGDTDVPEPERLEAGPAVDYLNALFNGPGGQAEMMRAFGLHLTIPGELCLVSYRDKGGDPKWVTASIDELTRNARNELVLDRGDGNLIKLDADAENSEDFVLRIWRSHGRRWWLADSPTHHALPVLTELEALSKGVLATIDSRLAGAGILLIPQELTFPPAENPGLHADPFMASLIEAMVTPLQDRESAASVVPFVLRGPAEFLDRAKLLQFGQELDKQTTPLREAALKRLAISLDTPPEALLGFGDSNHWSAWQISEEGVKLNIEPLCATICDALTTGYLWKFDDVSDDETIWFETSALTQRPDRGPDADAVYDHGELAARVLRREHGFSEDDAPTDEERRNRLLVELIKSNPEIAGQILPLLGLAKPGEIVIDPPKALPPSQDEENPDGDGDGDGKGAPDTKPEGGEPPPGSTSVLPDGLLLACEFAVHRALEVGGKRLLGRATRNQYQGTPPWQLHTHLTVRPEKCDELLVDAWTMFAESAPELAPLVPALDEHVRDLLTRGMLPDRSWLTDVLRRAVSREPVPA